jgi:hypothetical protein
MLPEGSRKEDERMARYVSIDQASGSSTEYDIRIADVECDVDDVLNDARLFGDIYELGVNKLPANVTDIRGCIRNRPNRVFAVDYGDESGGIHYFGFVE